MAAASARPPLLSVHDLAITHDGESVPTPAAASFEVAHGEVVLLLGPSGSGKSTLALALNGLIPHDLPADLDGRVEVDGLRTTDTTVAVLSTRVGMVFQDPDAQLVTGTVLDEVAFGPENLRMPVAEVLQRSEAALRRVGLWERRAENPDRLSGGGRQRLAIACALAMGSPLLVLDEPTANLDPRGVDEVYRALAEVVADGDRAVVLIEHNLDAAMHLVDRIVALDQEGRVIADGPARTLLQDRAAELHAQGVWLPASTLAALRLRRAGWVLDPLPLDPAELRRALEGEAGPVGAAGSSGRAGVPDAGGAGSSGAGAGGPRGAGAIPREAAGLDAGERPDQAAVRVRGLSLKRGRAEVLRDIDLDVARGSFTAVVGANGAGKTSLVQAIAGVNRPPRGTVSVGGLDIGRAGIRELNAAIGFVFQNPEHQFVAHSVRDELAYGLRRLRLSGDEIDERVSRMLDRFGLAAKADAHPFRLSGGQKRRLSVGTALIAGAPVLALDEPTFGQDRARAEELLSMLADLRAEGTTVLVVTHDMQLVTEYADHVIVLAGGEVVAAASTSTVFADDALIAAAGLSQPPLRRAFAGLTRHPSLAPVTRLADLPGGDR
ncbi:Putative HMP/thiamine import ATP-binding protein YkoD [Microbacterium lemovicicum]|uniref:HMP/thiamine import ATP-binding protein YkoD n=1 Tax=Microbacterium lemovicicum TaxID=1072463 RepID=A0A3Q9IWB1_9MICO|nr:ABC transporter ATP-binding protein [Microbacterium lemovicicum]AZS35561.1 Putative HMP/thiamine import ATP-binding protein YkoD [Microbacterium lemovicicum]